MLPFVIFLSCFYLCASLNVYKNNTSIYIDEYIPHWAKMCYSKTKKVIGVIDKDIDYYTLEHVNTNDLYHIFENAKKNNSQGILISTNSIQDFYERSRCDIPIAFIRQESDKLIDFYDKVEWSVDHAAEYIQNLCIQFVILVVGCTIISNIVCCIRNHFMDMRVHIQRTPISEIHIPIMQYNTFSYKNNVVDSENTSQETCAICLEDYKNEDALSRLECSHVFHNCCIEEWLKNKNKCPLCNFE